MMKAERQSNIELLRLVAMAGVIILHYNYDNIGGGFRYVTSGSINEQTLLLLESIAICGVNLFIMISGFFLSRTNTRSGGKALSIMVQVIVFWLVNSLIQILLRRVDVRSETFAYSLVPMNWFITLYLVLYLISPLINRAVNGIGSWKMIIGLVLLFSIIPTLLDVLYVITGNDFISLMTLGTNGSGKGYTIINFMLCYIIGAAINRRPLKKISTLFILLLLAADIVCIFLWGQWNRSTAWEYSNPLVIIEAALFIELFLRLDLGSNHAINTISQCALSVYLLHIYLMHDLRIAKFVQKPVFIMLLHILLSCIGIILFSFLVDLLYRLIMKHFNYWLASKWVYSI